MKKFLCSRTKTQWVYAALWLFGIVVPIVLIEAKANGVMSAIVYGVIYLMLFAGAAFVGHETSRDARRS